jgi:hypothetical protein
MEEGYVKIGFTPLVYFKDILKAMLLKTEKPTSP